MGNEKVNVIYIFFLYFVYGDLALYNNVFYRGLPFYATKEF